MKFQLLSDLHIEFDNFEVEDNDADLVILAGDIHVKDKGVHWALESIKNRPVLYVLGNHEFYGKAYPKHIETLRALTKDSNIHILENDTYSLDGINFLGCSLWTDFNLFGNPRLTGYGCEQIMTDYKKIRVSPKFSKLRSIDVTTIHRQSVSWLKSELTRLQGQTNIVITHHGPSTASLPKGRENDEASAAYISKLDSLIHQYSPRFWLHGHLHNSSNYEIANCRVICNPRGYPQERNPDFIKNHTIEI